MIAWLALAWATAPVTLQVPGDYDQLLDAVNAAGDGDTILVGPGVWTGPFQVTSDVAIVSTDGPATTVLQGLSPVVATVEVGGASVVVEGVTLACGQTEALSVVAGSATLTNARFSTCGGASAIGMTSSTVIVRDSVIDTLPTSAPGILSTGGRLDLDGVAFTDATPSDRPVIDSDGTEWTFRDVDVVGVDRAAPVFQGIGLTAVDWTRVAVRCSSAGTSAVSIDSVGSVGVGPLLVHGVATDVGGALLELTSLTAWQIEHATLVGEPTQMLVTANGSNGAVDDTAFAGGAAAVNGVYGGFVDGRYNLFEPGMAIATGDALESAVAGTGSVISDPLFEVWGPLVNCQDVLLAPQLASPLVDAGNPADSDRDGTRADIGATGGLEGFELLGDDRDQDGVADADDCEPLDPAIHPGAADPPYDGVDQDCDGVDITDVDGDGHDADVVGGDDCDDTDPTIHPLAEERLDAIDRDCDGFADPIKPIRPVGCDSSGRHACLWGMVGIGLLTLRRRRERT